MTEKHLSPEEIVDLFTAAFGDGVKSAEIRGSSEGVKKETTKEVWIRIDRALLINAIERLIELDYPHLGVISGSDDGEEIELLYHLFIYYGEHLGETAVILGVSLPKSDPTVPTITGLIPGALTSEREKQEMLGVTVVGIPDSRRIFLPDDFPVGVHPWRKDDKGIPAEMIKDLSETGRPAYREAHKPVVEPAGEVCEPCEVEKNGGE